MTAEERADETIIALLFLTDIRSGERGGLFKVNPELPFINPLREPERYKAWEEEERKRLQLENLKEKRKATILSHNYQRPEVQDIGDFVGDSLELSQKAAKSDAEVIVFCGVHFMAETAKILSPEKTVLIPDANAGCPMADMINDTQLRRKKQELPGYTVVTYINSTAAVKTESDYCCTSASVNWSKGAVVVLLKVNVPSTAVPGSLPNPPEV
jgi:quinolinate synthase